MDVVYPRCAGLDIHNKTVVACVIVQGPKGKPQKTIRTFGTMTDDLLALGDWLGEQDVSHVAMESTGAYWRPIPQLEKALTGSFQPHQQFMVARHLAFVDAIDELVVQVSAEIAERLRPAEHDLELLDEITGIGRSTAEVWLAEVGNDLERFPTPGHLASWAGMCPGNNESAGKRKTGKTRKGNPALRTAMVVAAHAAARKRDSYLSVQYRRLAARRGSKKAIVAVAHSLLVIAYYVLTRRVNFKDLGPTHFDERNRVSVQRQLVRRLQRMGYKVALEPIAA